MVTGSLIGVGIYLVIVLFIGYTAYKKNIKGNIDDYFLANRSLGVVTLVGTLFATWFSTFAFLGGPGLFYNTGTGWLQFGLFNVTGPLFIWVFGTRMWLLGKKFGCVTPADMLAGYYDSKGVRFLVAIISVLALFPYASIQLSGIAKAMTGFTGGAIPYWVGVVMVVISVGLYAYFGGARAIVWTDVIQGFFFAMLLIGTAFAVVYWAGGWDKGLAASLALHPEKFVFDKGQGNYYTLLLMWTLGWVLTPHLWQRMYMAESPRIMAKSMVIASTLALWVTTFTGLIIGYFGIGLLPTLPAGFDSDSLVPILYSRFFTFGGILLVIAAFASGMSTLDSQLLSTSSVFTSDLYQALYKPKAKGPELQKVGHIFMGAFTAALLVFALSAAGRALLIPLSSIGVGICLLFLAPLIGATYWDRGTKAGAFWSLLLGFIVLCLVQFTGFKHLLPGTWGSAFWGLVTSLIVYFGVSLLTSPLPEAQREAYHGFLAKAMHYEKLQKQNSRKAKLAEAPAD
jgi:SSS family solute:Na+ symporter